MSSTQSSIEEEHESTAALPGILSDFNIAVQDSLVYSVEVYIIVALDLFCVDSIGFDAFFKLVSLHFGFRHVRIKESVCKLMELSKLAVVLVADYEADLLVRFEEVADHARVIKHLFCTLGYRLWKGAKEVQGLDHDGDFLAFVGFLSIGIPSVEDVSCVGE